jgi:maltose alpha-D-glucosyltransferase/alpha-amylase
LIANYGGEPGRTWDERRRKHTPLRDVAGLLFSLGEVGAAALDHVVGDSAEVDAEIQRHMDEWERLAGRAFFLSYRRAMGSHPSYPADAATADALMTLSLAEKAISSASSALAGHSITVGSAMRQVIQVAQRER